jgi:hypothetical protein
MTSGTTVFGPALPTLDDVRSESPRWHCWPGIGGRLYARRLGASPPVVVGSSTALDLRTRIRDAEAGL